MFPGMNPRDMQKAMKRLGIKQEEIEAEVVIIKAAGRDIIIKNPQVSKVNMMGQETFQISGEISESEPESDAEISEEDISTVMQQAGCSREDAVEALENSGNNLAEAILKLQEK